MKEREIQDLPLPPYPDEIGHPLTHSFRAMPDPLSFRDATMNSTDVARNFLFGTGEIYNFAHPSHFKKVLIDDRDSFSKSVDFSIAFGNGLLASEGKVWQEQRKILQPLFSKEKIDSYISTMNEQIQRRVESWGSKETINLQVEMRRLTLDVLFATLFGEELEINGDEDIHEAATRLQDWFAPTSYPLPTWVPTPSRHRFKKGRTKIRKIAEEMLDEKAQNVSLYEKNDLSVDPNNNLDLLSILVKIRQSKNNDNVLSDEQLRDQVVTLIFAGHETTASTLALSLYEIARRPNLRRRFQAEIDNISPPISPSDLSDLCITEQIIKETLRLYPPIYIIPRESNHELAIDGYRVPEEVTVWLGVRQVHHDDRFYQDPKQFRPDRWNGNLTESIPNFAYAPFGGGPRLCIGRQFSLVEAKIALAIIGRDYLLTHQPEQNQSRGDNIVTIEDPPLKADMTLRLSPEKELYVYDR